MTVRQLTTHEEILYYVYRQLVVLRILFEEVGNNENTDLNDDDVTDLHVGVGETLRGLCELLEPSTHMPVTLANWEPRSGGAR